MDPCQLCPVGAEFPFNLHIFLRFCSVYNNGKKAKKGVTVPFGAAKPLYFHYINGAHVTSVRVRVVHISSDVVRRVLAQRYTFYSIARFFLFVNAFAKNYEITVKFSVIC